MVNRHLAFHDVDDVTKGDRAVAMFNDTSSPIALLHSRRSGKPRDMIAPGPDAAQLDQILRAAIRVPDHGKLAPWRFVVVGADQRGALSELLVRAYRAEKPEAGRLETEAMKQFANQAPALIVALSSPVAESKIPLWEQQLTVGAACMNLLIAAHALGFVGSWLTGWPAYSDTVRDAFGTKTERIAGFLFIGTPSRALDERPRPEFDTVAQHWNP
jgi:nitroreductase